MQSSFRKIEKSKNESQKTSNRGKSKKNHNPNFYSKQNYHHILQMERTIIIFQLRYVGLSFQQTSTCLGHISTVVHYISHQLQEQGNQMFRNRQK